MIELRGARILVTGASGFLASALASRLQSVQCTIVQATSPGRNPAPLAGSRANGIHVTGDVSERSFWTRTLQSVDVVFHLASQTSVYTADDNPPDDWRANVQPMLHLLETCREQNCRPAIVFAGSVTEVGLVDSLPVDETVRDRPVTVYDWHKLLAESYLEHYTRRGWARGATLRLANIYGPGLASSAKDRGILNMIMRGALRGDPLTLYGDGHYVRDYLFVDDAVEAFIAAAVNIDQVNGRHFVVGSGTGHTLAAAFALVAERAARLTGRQVPVVHIDAPPGLSPIETRNFVADSSSFASATGWKPRIQLPEGIDRSLQAFLASQSHGQVLMP